MKRIWCLGLVFVFVCFSATFSFAAEYNFDEAAKHIGEKATVCGKIVDTMPNQGMTILGMGAGVAAQGAVGIEVPDELKDKFDKDLYVGKTICVTRVRELRYCALRYFNAAGAMLNGKGQALRGEAHQPESHLRVSLFVTDPEERFQPA